MSPHPTSLIVRAARRYHFCFQLILLFAHVVIAKTAQAQTFVVDSCYTTVAIGTSFVGNNYIESGNADLMSWNGAGWDGSWSNAALTTPPPTGNIGCRAVFIGNGVTWTSGGESFFLALNQPLSAGVSYSFTFTYVSAGFGSTGDFAPMLYTSTSPSLFGATFVDSLPAAGFNWITNTLTFTASASQNGDTWIALFNGATGTSGMIASMCSTCNSVTPTCSVNLGSDFSLCDNASAVLHAGSHAAFLWSNGTTSDTLTVTQGGIYWVQTTDGSCVASDTLAVTASPNPSVFLGNDTTVCTGQSIQLSAGNTAVAYDWNNGSTQSTITVVAQGIYVVTLTNAAGCTASDSLLVTLLPTPSLSLTNQHLCGANDSVLIAAPSGFSYHWQNGTTTQNYLATTPGTYSLTVTSANGCSAAASANVNVVTTQVSLGGNKQACEGDQVVLNAAGNFDAYHWSHGSTVGTITVTQTGGYSVTVTNQGCTAEDSVYVNIVPYPVVALASDTVICEHTTLTLDAGANAEQYIWSNGASTQSIQVANAGIYHVLASNAGCITADSITVATVDCNLTFPNAFTPNGDGLNDVFRPVNPSTSIDSYVLHVYNRWGQLIFSSTDAKQGWNGTFNGKHCELGSYVWTCSYQNELGSQRESGSVTLVR